MKESEIWRYKYVIIILILDVLFFGFKPVIGQQIIDNTIVNFKSMLSVLPPIFLLLGLLDVWVPRETIIKYLGEGSGVLGVSLSIFLGSAAAGPLYVAFPIAMLMINKGAKFSNVMVFLGAWGTLKIPVVLFEIASLGWYFALIRWIINVPGIVVMAWFIDKLVTQQEKQHTLEQSAAKIA